MKPEGTKHYLRHVSSSGNMPIIVAIIGTSDQSCGLAEDCKSPSLEGLWMHSVTVSKIKHTPHVHAVTKTQIVRQLANSKTRLAPDWDCCSCIGTGQCGVIKVNVYIMQTDHAPGSLDHQ